MKLSILLFLVVLLAACAAPTPTPTSTPTPTATAVTTATPTFTPSPTFSAAPTDTATPGPTATPVPVSTALQEILDRVTARLPTVRQLEFKRQVSPRLMNRSDLQVYLEDQIEEKDREELKVIQELYAVLGLIEPGTDLYRLYLDLLSEQVLGLYDEDKDELFLVTEGGNLGLQDELTIVHEYTHALQQQYFDIASLSKKVQGHGDLETALLALIEGDARSSETNYGLTYYGRRALQNAARDTGPSPVFFNAPAVVQKTLVFPYDQGSRFVQALFDSKGSWEAVNEAFHTPPASTEQVLHPRAYFDHEEPLEVQLPDLAPALGQGWDLLKSDTMGEFLLRVYLEEHLNFGEAAAAAAGWGGDYYVLLTGPADERVLVLLTEWDTEKDAKEFQDSYLRFIPLAYGADLQDRKVRLSRSGRQVLVVFAPDQTTLDALLQRLALAPVAS